MCFMNVLFHLQYTVRSDWEITIFLKYKMCSSRTGSADQWSSLWLGQRGCQWGWCFGGRWCVPDSLLSELQEWGWREGHFQEAGWGLHQERCGLSDCRGKFIKVRIILKGQIWGESISIPVIWCCQVSRYVWRWMNLVPYRSNLWIKFVKLNIEPAINMCCGQCWAPLHI